jgi:hypothetical protein
VTSRRHEPTRTSGVQQDMLDMNRRMIGRHSWSWGRFTAETVDQFQFPVSDEIVFTGATLRET